MKLACAISPCPNDTFIFAALANQWIDTQGIDFEFIYEDIETLNRLAMNGEIPLVKVSYHAYLYIHDQYLLLKSGSALGEKCGPLLIAKSVLSKDELAGRSLILPGKMTTAHFLCNFYLENIDVKKTFMPFNEIEDALISGQYEMGVIIHENRFTYQKKGLKKIADLGEYWEQSTHYPIPLGGIALNRSFKKHYEKINRLVVKSIQYAYLNREKVMDFVASYAQEMDPEVMHQHISLYVNSYSKDLGKKGIKAVNYMLENAAKNARLEIQLAAFI